MTAPEQPLYETPAAIVARTAAVETYTQYEATLYAGYLAMMTEWLDAARATVFSGGVRSLALMPDPYRIFTQTKRWDDLVTTYTETVVRDVLDAAYHQVLPGVSEYASRPFVHNFIATSANKMKGTPGEVFGMVRQVVDSAVTNGASIPDITDQIDKLLSATGTDTWTNRAKTVARTEVHSAYAGGLYDAFAMLVESDPETDYVLRWLATEDDRTRPTHRAVDGVTTPYGMPFTVGGFPLFYPGDPAGPASEVINCRCTALLEEVGQPTDMTDRGWKLTAAALPWTLVQEACRSGEFCQETHKPGLCKGQHRGGTEPTAIVGDKAKIQRASAAIAQLNASIRRLQTMLLTATDPKQRQAIGQTINGYRKQLRPHLKDMRDEKRINDKAQRQAVQDAAQQDAIDKRAAKRHGSGASTKLKPYQTSTKL